jgi:hypothetical protein
LFLGSSESPGDVRIGSLFAGTRKDLICRSELDELPRIKESSVIGRARGLLKVVRHDDDRQLLFQLVDELLDFLSGARIECASRLVEQQNLRLVGERPRDAYALLLPAR